MLRLLPALLALALLAGTPGLARAAAMPQSVVVAAATTSADLPLFDTEAAAQKHCPNDSIVWLNTNSGIYHEKRTRWYGKTKHGADVCKKEPDAAGDRDTRNGQ